MYLYWPFAYALRGLKLAPIDRTPPTEHYEHFTRQEQQERNKKKKKKQHINKFRTHKHNDAQQ